MSKNSNLEISLFETITDKSLNLGVDIAELTIDQFIENDLLKEIPFFSIFYKSIKTVQGIRDALFAMKVYKFIKEFEQIKPKDKEEFLEKITSDRKEKTKIGQTLIMILDKIDELDKTHFIANIFAAYLKTEISKSELTQFCSIIEKAFIDDLLLFSKMEKNDDLPKEIQANLSSLGLMTPIIMDIKSMYGDSVIIDDNNKNMLVYVISKMGMKMRKHILK
ncbi:hypothetical protein [Sinomicrobium weinanense]|uniref:Uncharacterized protein n=1 Tax=Sinomicrobium weinanense TaxID=2842200 RepID=A0A926Q2N1_9FLAO|nr:hypothetical protein [Sinomicrobium weinanense]MBC9796807.1 hypothetical protein [Sinomicrobium weinanense]MBU3123689.1 hypothetical protein [Sinomicrobium weinanense]